MTAGPLIVLATDSSVPSGVGEHMLTLARALEARYQVALAFPARGDGTRFLRRSLQAGHETRAIHDRSAFSGWLRLRRPAILHVHAGIGWEGHQLVEAGRNAGVPVVRTEHLPYLLTDPDQKQQHDRAARLAHGLVAVSEAAAESYRAQGFSSIVTIRNGIDAPEARRARSETRASLDIAEDVPVVLTVARFTPQKGHGVLVQAMVQVAQRVPRALFILVGDGPDKAAIEALATTSVLENVLFLGRRPDVPDLLAAADLFVLPSLFEGLPLVVLEAMALELPVVATRVGGTVEALGSDHPFLVTAASPSLLAAAIVTALCDDDLRRAVGRKQRLRFEERFTASRMGLETAELYDELARRTGSL